MALIQDYKKITTPSSPGILMVEPSLIPFYKFDCEIMNDFNFFKKGEKIQIDILPVELGNKLVLHTGKKEENQIEIKLTQINHIGFSEEEMGFMDKKNLFVKILLENNAEIMLDFDDYKIHDFVSTVNSLSEFSNTCWDFFEVEFSKENKLRSTKIYYKLPFLAEGEKLLWSYVGTEGALIKKASFVMALTSFRAVLFNFDTRECEFVLLSHTDDILVTNPRRVSQSIEIDSFTSVELYTMRMFSGPPLAKEITQIIGNVVFMKDGERKITFGQMKDPQGLVHLAESIKQNIVVQEKPNIAKPVKQNIVVQEKPDIANSTLSPNYVDELSKYLKNSDWSNVEKLANFILKKNPDNFIALRAKLGAYIGEQKWEEIVKVSEHMLNFDSENFDARTELPKALLNLQEIEQAEKALIESLNIYPDEPQLLSIKKQLGDFRTSNPLPTFKKCNDCSNENTKTSTFCNQCGVKLDSNCTRCGHLSSKNASFCNKCGFSFK